MLLQLPFLPLPEASGRLSESVCAWFSGKLAVVLLRRPDTTGWCTAVPALHTCR